MKIKLITIGLLLSVASLFASEVMVNDAYVRATPPNIKMSAAFMLVTNKSANDLAIVSAKSNIANKVEIHTHDMVNGMMKMYQVKKVDLKAKSHAIFAPGGFHIMFIGLNKSLKVGENVDFTLVLSNADEINVSAPVKKVMAGMNQGKMNGMKNNKMPGMQHGKM